MLQADRWLRRSTRIQIPAQRGSLPANSLRHWRAAASFLRSTMTSSACGCARAAASRSRCTNWLPPGGGAQPAQQGSTVQHSAAQCSRAQDTACV